MGACRPTADFDAPEKGMDEQEWRVACTTPSGGRMSGVEKSMGGRLLRWRGAGEGTAGDAGAIGAGLSSAGRPL